MSEPPQPPARDAPEDASADRPDDAAVVAAERATIEGATLSFRARAMKTSLQAILARLPPAGDGAPLAAPRIEVKTTPDQLVFEPVRDLALREIIGHARDGRAKAIVPLLPTTLRLGPLAIDIPAGSAVVADVVVADGRFVFASCRGRIEPPITLPLGFTFKGIDLDDDGDLRARIGGLPDLNLSRLLGFSVPERLADALDVAFARADARAAAQPDAIVVEGGAVAAAEPPPLQIDLAGIVVEATAVAPTTTPLSLGSLGQVTLGEATRLDITYRADRLTVAGHVDVRDALLVGEAFRIEKLRGAGALTWELARAPSGDRISLQVRDAAAAVDALIVSLTDGTRLHVGASDVVELSAQVEHGDGPLRFSVRAPRTQGALTSGVVVAHVAHQRVPVRIKDVDVAGAFDLAHDHFRVDVEVARGAAAADGFVVDVGLLRLDLGAAEATARGRLRAGTDMGAQFSGALTIHGAVHDGALRFGPIEAGLASGTRAALLVEEVAAGPDGLDQLLASGEIHLVVRSGTVPIGPSAALGFSRGAAGKLVLAKVAAKRGVPWPVVEGMLHLRARSDAAALDPLLVLPPGEARVALGRFALDDVGVLVLEDIAVDLASDASA